MPLGSVLWLLTWSSGFRTMGRVVTEMKAIWYAPRKEQLNNAQTSCYK